MYTRSRDVSSSKRGGYRRVAPSMYIRKHARGAGGIQCSHPSEGQRPYPSDSLWASLQKLPDMLGCFRMRRPFNVFYMVPETRPVQPGLMRSNAVSMLNDDEDETNCLCGQINLNAFGYLHGDDLPGYQIKY